MLACRFKFVFVVLDLNRFAIVLFRVPPCSAVSEYARPGLRPRGVPSGIHAAYGCGRLLAEHRPECCLVWSPIVAVAARAGLQSRHHRVFQAAEIFGCSAVARKLCHDTWRAIADAPASGAAFWSQTPRLLIIYLFFMCVLPLRTSGAPVM